MTHNNFEALSYRVRREIIKLSGRGGCFIGASLSCVEILTYLYNAKMQYELDTEGKHLSGDIFLLSKGHDVPALYSLFAELGIINKSRLENHLDGIDDIYWHPNPEVPGVHYHSGSLGQIPSVAIGIALAKRLRSDPSNVYVLMGDGELNEGSVWEAFMISAAKKLNNLTFLIDRNGFQANLKTEDLIPLEPLDEKLKSFGLAVGRCDGHSFKKIAETFSEVEGDKGERPRVIIFDTIRGKGLPSIENRADRWFCSFTSEEVDQLLIELDGGSKASISSEKLIVR